MNGKIQIFGVIINLFQIYDDPLQMLNEDIFWACLYCFVGIEPSIWILLPLPQIKNIYIYIYIYI